MSLSRIDYEDPRLVTAMKNHKDGTMTKENIEYMAQSFRKGNSNIVKLKVKEMKKWNWCKFLGISS